MYPTRRVAALARPRAEAPIPRVDGSTATIRLYDVVDSYGNWFGISAKEIAEMLDGLPELVDTIVVRINSAGGDVFDAVAIKNLLAAHPARIVAVVDGLAASAASFIATSADETIMSPHATLMVHDAWGVCVGDAGEMRAMAATLDQVSGVIASMYAAKAGGTADHWREVMSTESWFTSEEAVAAGLADRVDDQTGPDEPVSPVDTSAFRFSGRANAPAPDLAATSGEPTIPVEEQAPVAFHAPLTHLFV